MVYNDTVIVALKEYYYNFIGIFSFISNKLQVTKESTSFASQKHFFYALPIFKRSHSSRNLLHCETSCFPMT